MRRASQVRSIVGRRRRTDHNKVVASMPNSNIIGGSGIATAVRDTSSRFQSKVWFAPTKPRSVLALVMSVPGTTNERHAGLQRRDAAVREIAAPETDRAVAYAERLGNLQAGPARQRQQHGAGTVRSPRSREPASAVRAARWSSVAESCDFPAVAWHLRIGPGSESAHYPLVNQAESAQLKGLS